MKIAICIPHNHFNFDKIFVMSLVAMVNYFYMFCLTHEGWKHELHYYIQQEGDIDVMRSRLARTVQKEKADLVLWLDTDMAFPQDMIVKMVATMKENKELDAVSGLYTHKQPPYPPQVYYKYDEESDCYRVSGGFPLDKPFMIEAAALGCCMMRMALLERIPKGEKPFVLNRNEEGQIVKGEDLDFFKRVRPVKMVCDPTIVCQHLLQYPIDINNYVNHNKILIKDNRLCPTAKQLEKISSFWNGDKNKN